MRFAEGLLLRLRRFLQDASTGVGLAWKDSSGDDTDDSPPVTPPW